jgi:type I restriction enzyme M protein
VTLAEVAGNDFNLSPSRYVAVDGEVEVISVEDAVVLLAEAEEERQTVDLKLDEVISSLGFEGWRSTIAKGG